MNANKTSVFQNGLIWFGAAVSVAEIITGTYFAPLGFTKGILAIIIGHVIGCILLFCAGIIGAKTGKSAMDTVKISFGNKGSMVFALLNIVQLIGWTAIMIYDGAVAANEIWNTGQWVWCIIIGGLIIMWIIMGIKNSGKINTIAMAGLFVLSVVLNFVIFKDGAVHTNFSETMSFGAAVELSVAMPLSWLPLISDYTKEAKAPVKATLVSSIVYGIVSCWMYVIGMGAAVFTGEYDVAKIMLKSGLGIAGLLIIVFSTVTTTFLDAYSAGVSTKSIWNKVNDKKIAVIVAIIGAVTAIIYPITDITDFLYLIGSVFAPMIAIQIADFMILKKDYSDKTINTTNIIIWIMGFMIYRGLMTTDIVIGSTIPDMILTILICIAVDKIFTKK